MCFSVIVQQNIKCTYPVLTKKLADIIKILLKVIVIVLLCSYNCNKSTGYETCEKCTFIMFCKFHAAIMILRAMA